MKNLIAALLSVGTMAHADHAMDNRDLANGAELYQTYCAACHGANLEGQPNWRTPDENGVLPAPPHDVTGHTWHHDDQLLFDYVRLGGDVTLTNRGVSGFQSGMPAIGDDVSDDEIWNILAYIRSTWPEDAQKVQAARNPPH